MDGSVLVKPNKLSFSSIENNKPLLAPVHSVSQVWFKFRSQFYTLYIVESKERLFHQFTSNFPNRNSFWQKLHMKPTLQKIPGYKDGIAWNRSLWHHKGRSVKILYTKNYLTYRVGVYLILSRIYVFLKTFKASATIYNQQAPKSTYPISHIFVKSLCWWYKMWVNG